MAEKKFGYVPKKLNFGSIVVTLMIFPFAEAFLGPFWGKLLSPIIYLVVTWLLISYCEAKYCGEFVLNIWCQENKGELNFHKVIVIIIAVAVFATNVISLIKESAEPKTTIVESVEVIQKPLPLKEKTTQKEVVVEVKEQKPVNILEAEEAATQKKEEMQREIELRKQELQIVPSEQKPNRESRREERQERRESRRNER